MVVKSMNSLKRFVLAMAALFVATTVVAKEVKWSHSVTEKGDGLYTVTIKADIADGWHIYVTPSPGVNFNSVGLNALAGSVT